MEKLVQSSPALAVDCWISICPGAVVCTVAWPLVFTGPVGSAKPAGAATSRHMATLMGVRAGVNAVGLSVVGDMRRAAETVEWRAALIGWGLVAVCRCGRQLKSMVACR